MAILFQKEGIGERQDVNMGRGHIVGLESHHATVFHGFWSKGGAVVGSLSVWFPVHLAFRPTRHQGRGHCERICRGAQ